jgi:hypothetical protein
MRRYRIKEPKIMKRALLPRKHLGLTRFIMMLDTSEWVSSLLRLWLSFFEKI